MSGPSSSAPWPAALPDDWRSAAEACRRELAETRPTVATRKASEAALEVLTEAVPELVGGSADLTALQQHGHQAQRRR